MKYNDVVAFIENNKRNPSKHDDEERGLYLNWIKHNKRLYGSNLFTRLNYWIVTLGGQVLVTPPEINSVEAPSSATIVCQGDTFTFKLDQAPADNGGIFLVIEATGGQKRLPTPPAIITT